MRSHARQIDTVGVRAVAALITLAALAGCTQDVSTTLDITVTSDGCRVSPASTASGQVLFTVTNKADEVAAIEIRTGENFVGAIGNIAPGISRDLVLVLAAGDYVAACTPGPAAPSATTAFSVADSGVTVVPSASTAEVSASYQEWVRGRTAELREATAELSTAFDAGDPEAQQLYLDARELWASLRPVLQRFPELLPAIDARESDLVVGERLSGWHALEKDLWAPSDYQPLDSEARAALSAELRADLAILLDRVNDLSLTPEQIADGAQSLIDAASRTLSDGDERWSHAELTLVQGDLDGATAAIEALRPALDPEILALIDDRSASLQNAIDNTATMRELAARIDALAAALATIDLGNARIEP